MRQRVNGAIDRLGYHPSASAGGSRGGEQAIEVIAPLLIRYYYFLAVPTDDVSGERARGYDLCSEGPYE
jgi:DNA-binding LacI/PurR family transcriptional regulator